ncbi:MAG: N-acetylmuramoyl-L-alanine amidase [Pseudomonadota bacterium]
MSVAGAVRRPSPNFGPRRGGAEPSLVVLHYTAMTSAEAALDWLCAPQSQVSAHYLIGRDGRIWQMVDERDRAWHAGAGRWRDIDDVNSASIGIEIDNPGDVPFSEPSMAMLERALADILVRWGIAPAGVIGHSDLAPGRKIDPGVRFDWRRLARRGLSVWPVAAAGGARDLEGALAEAGYTAPVPAEVRLAAFRARFRPCASGPVEDADLELLASLGSMCE